MSTTYRNIIYMLITLVLSCISMYWYTNSILNDLTYYNTYGLQEGVFISVIELVVFIGLSTYLLQKIIQKTWRILLITFLYAVVLQELFFNIAFSLRAEFGATWTTMEVLFELVLNYKNTMILLGLTVVAYYLLLRFLRTKNRLITNKL